MFQNINYALGLRIAHVIAVLGYPEDVSLDACAVYKALHRPELCFCRNAYDETSTVRCLTGTYSAEHLGIDRKKF